MTHFPKLPYSGQSRKREIVAIRGLNYSDDIADGDMAESRNVSTKRYPYLTTRNARERQARQGAYYENVAAMATFAKLVVAEEDTQEVGGETVDGYQLFYDGVPISGGFVATKPTQFVQINTKIVVWPNRIYIDIATNTPTIGNLEAEVTAPISIAAKNQFSTNSDISAFSAGDGITITANNVEYVGVILSVAEAGGTTTVTMTAAEIFTGITGLTLSAKIERKVPDMAFICQFNNRIMGCDAAGKAIYASALGMPQNWNVNEGVSTDSWAVNVATPGPFTGCIALSSSVLFWKEEHLHKLYGSYPAEFTVNTYDMEGLREGCHKSMQIINEVLYYVGLHGVYAYSGGTPQLLSSRLGNINITNAVAGVDGSRYYLSFGGEDGWRLLAFDTLYSMWMQEDNLQALDFARIGRNLYFLGADKRIWLMDNGEPDPEIEWHVQFTPFFETIEGRKRYSKLMMRVELPAGSYILPQVRYDGGPWTNAGMISGADADSIPLQLNIQRCDKFEVRLSGKGPCTILSIMRDFAVGSDR